MNTNKTLGSNKQHSDRECLYKAEVTMTGKGTRFQEWMPVFFTVEGANKQVISSQADSLIKISRIWADFFPANTSNQPI